MMNVLHKDHITSQTLDPDAKNVLSNSNIINSVLRNSL